MNVAEALPLVTVTSRRVKYTIEPAGSVRPESPYCGAPSTTALIQTASVTRTPTTIGRAWIAGDATDAGAAVAVADGEVTAAVMRWADITRVTPHPADSPPTMTTPPP